MWSGECDWGWLVRVAGAFVRIARAACAAAIPLVVADALVVGVLGCGVRSSVPGLVRADALARVEACLPAEDVALVEAAYSVPNASGVRRFVGRPSLLSPLSRLSHALAGAGGGPAWVLGEYEALGLGRATLRAAYLRGSLRTALGCVALLCATATCPAPAPTWGILVRFMRRPPKGVAMREEKP